MPRKTVAIVGGKARLVARSAEAHRRLATPAMRKARTESLREAREYWERARSDENGSPD